MHISPALLGLLRGIVTVAAVPVLTFLGDATHLQGVLNPMTASIVAALALSFEHYFESHTGAALFGAVKVTVS